MCAEVLYLGTVELLICGSCAATAATMYSRQRQRKREPRIAREWKYKKREKENAQRKSERNKDFQRREEESSHRGPVVSEGLDRLQDWRSQLVSYGGGHNGPQLHCAPGLLNGEQMSKGVGGRTGRFRGFAQKGRLLAEDRSIAEIGGGGGGGRSGPPAVRGADRAVDEE